jgi:hypothetical protein
MGLIAPRASRFLGAFFFAAFASPSRPLRLQTSIFSLC